MGPKYQEQLIKLNSEMLSSFFLFFNFYKKITDQKKLKILKDAEFYAHELLKYKLN